MDFEFYPIVGAGLNAIIDYLLSHTLFCLVPAFFIAGAMATLIPQGRLLKYLGKDSPKYKAYPIAVASGLLLATCSCTVIPLFAGIRKGGAGLGPAITFLYTAPATNIVAVLYTGSLIGWDIAGARIASSVLFAIFIGAVMTRFLPDKSNTKQVELGSNTNSMNTKGLFLLFGLLVTILFVGTRIDDPVIKYGIEIGLIGAVALVVKKYLQKSDFIAWMKETFGFVKTIGPYLLIGVFFSGILIYLLPREIIANYVGDNSLSAIALPVIFGAFAYFPTLVEVPMANAFLQLGMARGPLLAYLLADPVVSLPSLLSVRKLIGNKRILVYVGMIAALSICAGYLFGVIST